VSVGFQASRLRRVNSWLKSMALSRLKADVALEETGLEVGLEK